jgi:hypothetical protein
MRQENTVIGGVSDLGSELDASMDILGFKTDMYLTGEKNTSNDTLELPTFDIEGSPVQGTKLKKKIIEAEKKEE